MLDEVVNCDLCGRDTRNNCRVCGHCLSGKPSYVRHNGEQRGRRLRGDLRATVEDSQEDEDTSDTRYHGDNYE